MKKIFILLVVIIISILITQPKKNSLKNEKVFEIEKPKKEASFISNLSVTFANATDKEKKFLFDNYHLELSTPVALSLNRQREKVMIDSIVYYQRKNSLDMFGEVFSNKKRFFINLSDFSKSDTLKKIELEKIGVDSDLKITFGKRESLTAYLKYETAVEVADFFDLPLHMEGREISSKIALKIYRENGRQAKVLVNPGDWIDLKKMQYNKK
jgi:hypothetical protein